MKLDEANGRSRSSLARAGPPQKDGVPRGAAEGWAGSKASRPAQLWLASVLLVLPAAWPYVVHFMHNLITGDASQSVLHLDSGGGWWFLSFGRNFVYPTEAFFHLLFFGGILATWRKQFTLKCEAEAVAFFHDGVFLDTWHNMPLLVVYKNGGPDPLGLGVPADLEAMGRFHHRTYSVIEIPGRVDVAAPD